VLSFQIRRFASLVTLSLVLLFSNFSAHAQWAGIASSDDRGGYDVYFDPSLSASFDGVANIWLLFDFKVIQKAKTTPYSSYKIQMEIDCKNYIGRILGYMDFLEGMGKGIPVRTNSAPQSWTPLIPDGKDRILWNVACSPRQST
jgi:hypothetical protein